MFEPAMARHFSAEVPYLADILAGHERWRPGQPALVCGNQRLTWQHLGRVSNQVAHGLLGHGLPAANAAATWRDDRGRAWLRTGDLGRVDDEGFLSIVGRKKDMIISGGQNVYPSDIEAVVLEHPDVVAVSVIGVPSRQWGETRWLWSNPCCRRNGAKRFVNG